jgi:hypothetical protein
MTTTDQCNTSSPPTLTEHINFGDAGLGPEGERFIRIIIDVGDEQHNVLMPYDGFVSGSRTALAQLNKHGAHFISSRATSEFLQRLQDLGPQQPSFNVATRVGPFGDAFVLPDTVISAIPLPHRKRRRMRRRAVRHLISTAIWRVR